MTGRFSKYQVATGIAILFHTIGLAGILLFDKDWIVRTTPLNLLLMAVLLIWTQTNRNIFFWIFFSVCFITGIAVEMIGINTGLLFGNYVYGEVLGPQINNVSWIIGVNWFIVMYCCGVAMQMLVKKITSIGPETPKPKILQALTVILDGATIAVFFDWVMEPVAVKLDYWTWLGTGEIPWFNYFCWFVVSALLLTVFWYSNFEKKNKFAVNLLLIQFMFFLVLRTFMN